MFINTALKHAKTVFFHVIYVSILSILYCTKRAVYKKLLLSQGNQEVFFKNFINHNFHRVGKQVNAKYALEQVLKTPRERIEIAVLFL